jgi:membrane protease YdiL (CAAX protease family)
VLSTILFYLVPAIILYVTHYILVPSYLQRTGHPYLVGYLIGWGSTMFMFFIAAFAAYGIEGNPWTIQSFAERYRLNKINGKDIIWTLAVLVFMGTTYFGLGFTTKWLARITIFAPHPSFAPEFGPEGVNAHVPGAFMGMVLKGKWWVSYLFFIFWFFNIAGEELWFRGYILPRQERAIGKNAWIANSLIFWLNHIWQPWNLLVILPGVFFGVYIAQRRKNTWILLISHGLLNLSLPVIVFLNVAGFRI